MDDPILKEYKVFVTSQLSQYLHLIQTPSRTHLPNSNGGALPGRYKKNSRHVELDVPVDTRHQTYCRARGEELATSALSGAIKLLGSQFQSGAPQVLDKVTLAGVPVAKLNAKYFVGIIRNDELHLTPLESVIQMRPALKYLDDIDAKTKASTKKIAEMDRPVQTEATRSIQVQFRKKETEEQLAARLNSYAYLKRQLDEEAWTNLSHFSSDCQEASKVAERLLCESQEHIRFKSQAPKDYLDLFFNE